MKEKSLEEQERTKHKIKLTAIATGTILSVFTGAIVMARYISNNEMTPTIYKKTDEGLMLTQKSRPKILQKLFSKTHREK